MRIAYDYDVEPAIAAANACLEVFKAEDKNKRDLMTAREEIERLHRIIKNHGIRLED